MSQDRLTPTSEGRAAEIIPPEIMKKITAAMKAELSRNWQSDDDVIDSFSRIAALAFLEGGAAMLPDTPISERPATIDLEKSRQLASKNVGEFQKAVDRLDDKASEASEKLQDHPKNLKPTQDHPKKPKPTLAELEWILAAPDGYFGPVAMQQNGEVRATLGPRLLELLPISATPAILDEALRRCADYHGDDALLDAPCIFCAYNGAGYWQSGTHAPGCRWHQIGGFEDRRAALTTRPDSRGVPK